MATPSSGGSPIDYANSLFQYPTLDRIIGEPKYESLRNLKMQLKANAITVGGNTNFGYLGLVLTPTEFAQVSNTPFQRPQRPAPLNIPQFTQYHQAFNMQQRHQEQLRKYNEYENVEKALIKQLVAAVDRTYIKCFENHLTGSITANIPTILAHLFRNYGRVTSEQLAKEEEKVNTYYWPPTDPPDVLFNMIEELAVTAEAASLPKTLAQLINYGLNAVRKTGEYERALAEWFATPEQDKTWVNFKTHFTDAQQQLRLVRGESMRNTPFHQANLMLQEEVRKDFESMQDDIVTSLNSIAEMAAQNNQPPAPEPAPAPAPSANAAMRTASNEPVTMEKLMQMFDSKIANLETRLTSSMNNGNGSNPGYRGGRNNNNNNNNNNTNNRRVKLANGRIVDKYCYSHGACNHAGTNCNNPRPDHKPEATFQNRMGGSRYYVRQAMELLGLTADNGDNE